MRSLTSIPSQLMISPRLVRSQHLPFHQNSRLRPRKHQRVTEQSMSLMEPFITLMELDTSQMEERLMESTTGFLLKKTQLLQPKRPPQLPQHLQLPQLKMLEKKKKEILAPQAPKNGINGAAGAEKIEKKVDSKIQAIS